MEEFKDDINLGENVVKTLKGIYDPEIPVDIVFKFFHLIYNKLILIQLFWLQYKFFQPQMNCSRTTPLV